MELQRLTTLLESESESAWSAALFRIARDLGFDCVMYAAIPSKHTKLETAFIHSNYSPEWRQRYDAEKMVYVDPTVRHCMVRTVPIVWEPSAFDGNAQRALYEEACHFGIRSGITLPMHGPGGEMGLISFASDARPGREFDDDLDSSLRKMSLVRDYVFESSLKFLNRHNGAQPMPRLTKRELEVLKWAMAGKSSWEISRITTCSEATVNFHMANIRQKFNVNTRQQALVKAIALGIISPEDPRR